jgi:choline-sulfatase
MRKTPWIPFDDLAQVPLVVAGPGIAGGRRESALVQNYDLVPTFLDYAGIEQPAIDFDSRSLYPVLEQRAEPADLNRSVFCGISLLFPTVRRGRFKYMQHLQHGQPMLFDLDADPHESRNLVEMPEYEPIASELAQVLRSAVERPALSMDCR